MGMGSFPGGHFAVGEVREGETLTVARAVSPSRALPLLATPLFCAVEISNELTGRWILRYRNRNSVPMEFKLDEKTARFAGLFSVYESLQQKKNFSFTYFFLIISFAFL